jgi:two-component system cell cycle sensor histidine kinase/response regulator CckA
MAAANILVVEDEKIIARGIEKRLQGLGYAVAGLIGNGEQAVAEAAGVAPDLILMDINLGDGIDGIEAARRIQQRIDVPVIFLTAFSDDGTLQRAKLTQPHGYILKPYEDKDLQTAIEIGLYRHRMERRLRENEQWLASTLGSIGDGVIASNAEGRVRFMNPLAERLTGWTHAEAVGEELSTVFRIVDDGTREEIASPAQGTLKSGKPSELMANTILKARDGTECPVDHRASPIHDTQGQLSGTVLVFRDITERRQLEANLRQAQKMEAIGRLAGGIAHDFNNIMMIISGFSDLLLDGDHLSEEHREYVGNIQEAGKRAGALTQQIMAFSRKQLLMPCVLNLNSVVEDMTAMARRLIRSNIELVTTLAPQPGPVKADPTQIGQIILNLVANARDAMPAGGRLSITTANIKLAAKEISFIPAGAYARLTVSDEGCGIAADVLPQIFEPFFTTKALGQGTGLGLATVYGIVKQSGGYIVVTSELLQGTTFHVYFPLLEEVVLPEEDEKFGLASPGKETVLLVEDEEMVRMLTRMGLEREGYTVLEAADGREALRIADTHPDPIHLLMTDLVMPYLSGREVADALLAAHKVNRVVFMSGFTDDLSVLDGLNARAVDFQAKPFTVSEMLIKVREVLDRI